MNSKGSNDPPLEKKRRLSVRDLPQFCDTAGTVSVASFGARRLPELRHLWEKTFRRASTPDPSNVESLKSTGCKTSRRHLRRRATSHLGRKHHRFPAGQQDANAQDKKSEHSIIDEPKLTRRKRRRNTEHLHSSHEEWKVPKGALGIPSTEDKESNGNKHRPDNWMPTHLWHAKRFHMESIWGWKVPMLHSNRGAKAALRLAREGKTILHDATWTSQPVWLRIATEVVPDMIDQIRIIIPDFALDETKLLEAFAYQPSAFPKGGIGPVAWLCSTSPLFGSAKDDTQSCYIYFFVHPSIQQTLLHILRQILEPSTLTGPLCFVHGGLSWLRLRGKAALESLQTAMLSIAKNEKRSTDIGAIIADFETGIDCQLSHVQCRAATNHETPNSQEVKLILRRPVQVDFHGNFGSCGVDVVCEPSLGQKLLVALVLHGMACPIGVTELAHLELECEPPRPLFPRDYPDTSVGMSYWKAALPEWKILRAYYEGGLGRIRPDRTSQQVLISWNTILPTDFQLLASENETTVVTVRGSFGQPFQQAINGIGYIHRNGDKASNSGAAAESLVIRRSRRKSGNPSLPVQAPPISRDQVSQHRNLCKTLLLSLSLPAVLLAHICLHEKGQLDTGTLLYATDGSVNEPLGVVTAAIFSSGRGRYHGIAVVGAARLLEALQHAHDSCAGRIVAPRVGPKRIELEIGVARSNTYNEKHSTAKLTMFGTLSLLL